MWLVENWCRGSFVQPWNLRYEKWPYLKGDTFSSFSKAHYFGYPFASFQLVFRDVSFQNTKHTPPKFNEWNLKCKSLVKSPIKKLLPIFSHHLFQCTRQIIPWSEKYLRRLPSFSSPEPTPKTNYSASSVATNSLEWDKMQQFEPFANLKKTEEMFFF